jgi:hypothetical protein
LRLSGCTGWRRAALGECEPGQANLQRSRYCKRAQAGESPIHPILRIASVHPQRAL